MDLPEIGTYQDISNYLKLSRKTVYKMVSLGDFPKNVYLGRGRFNMERLKYHIEKFGTFLKVRER